ncbi:MAG: C25 family cysteine peptidase [Candidatus Omnitrophota bacterium]
MKKYITVFLTIIFISMFSIYSFAETTEIPIPECNAVFSKDAKGDHISAKGYAVSGSPGDPALPYQEISIIIPSDADGTKTSVELKDLKEVDIGTYDMAPMPPYITYFNGKTIYEWGEGKRIDARTGRNQIVYGQSEFYPKEHVQVITVGNMRQYKIARIRYYPYIWHPRTGQLRQIKQGSIILKYQKSTVLSKGSLGAQIQDTALDDIVASITVNYKKAQDYSSNLKSKIDSGVKSSQGATTFLFSKLGYLIITTDYICKGSTKLQDFINYKKECGFEVYLATENSVKDSAGITIDNNGWRGGKTGHERSNNIRSYLQAVYLPKNIKYVLFIGNPNPYFDSNRNPGPASYDIPAEELEYSVPMKIFLAIGGAPYYGGVPSDYYYADLTGSWDLNNNGVYAEPDELFSIYYDGAHHNDGAADFYPEVIVGRIPFYRSFKQVTVHDDFGDYDEFVNTPNGNFADLDHILEKSINYGKGKFAGAWVKKALLSMKPFKQYAYPTADAYDYLLGEAIKSDILDPLGFQAIRVYDTETYDKVQILPLSLLREVDAGNIATPVTPSIVKAKWQERVGFHFWATHGQYDLAGGIFESLMCKDLDDNYPSFTFQASCSTGRPDVYYNLAYILLKHGAIATIGASTMMWGLGFNRADDNCIAQAYRYAGHLIKDHFSCGDAFWAMKTETPVSINCGDHYLINVLTTNLYGDPSLKYMTETMPPTGSILINNGAPYTNSELVIFNLSASDSGSGMGLHSQMMFSNDNVNWTRPEPFNRLKEWVLDFDGNTTGAKTVYVKFADEDGNWSQVYSDDIIFNADASVPTTSIVINPNGVWSMSTVDVILRADNGRFSKPEVPAKIYYSIDGSIPNLEYGGSFNISEEGEHVVKYYARRGNDGVQEAIKTTIVKIDKTPPTGNISLWNIDGYCTGFTNTNNTNVYAVFNASDYLSGVAGVRIANSQSELSLKQYEAYRVGRTVTWLLDSGNDGLRTVYIQFKDIAGNESIVYDSKINLDSHPAVTTVSFVDVAFGEPVVFDENKWYRPLRFSLRANEALSHCGAIYVSTDGNNPQDDDRNDYYSDWEDHDIYGPIILKYYSRDKAGNRESMQVKQVKVDNTPPKSCAVSINSGVKAVNSCDVTLTLAAIDNQSGLGKVSVNNEGLKYAEFPYLITKPWQLSGTDGFKNVVVNFFDKVGNYSSVCKSIILDRLKPITTDNVDNNWHKIFTVVLNAVDPGPDNELGSGVSKTYYATDGVNPTISSPVYSVGKGIVLDMPGNYTIKYFSVDNAGNVEDIKTAACKVKIDAAKPFGRKILINNGAPVTTSLGVDLTNITAEDNISLLTDMQMCFSNRSNSGYSSWEKFDSSRKGWSLTTGPDGVRTVYVKFRDTAGNISEPIPATIILDTVAPQTNLIDADTNKIINLDSNLSIMRNNMFRLKLNAVEANRDLGVWAFFSVSGAEPNIPYSPNNILPIPSSCVFKYYSKDRAGNIERPIKSVSIVIDKIPPTAPVITACSYSNAGFSLKCSWQPSSDSQSGVVDYEYMVVQDSPRGVAIINWSSLRDVKTNFSISYNGFKYGVRYYVYIRAVDAAGNKSLASRPATFLVSNQPPIANMAANGLVVSGQYIVGKSPFRISFSDVSRDPDGKIVYTRWEFFDRKGRKISEFQGKSITKVFQNQLSSIDKKHGLADTYKVRLTVEDNYNKRTIIEKTINVRPY